MKCTIKSVRTVEFKDNRIGCRVEGFIPMSDMSIIPDHILKWMFYYEGVKAVTYENGIFIAAWSETTCSEKDTYDLGKGKHIAESKAKTKIYRFVRNFSGYMSDYFEAMSNNFQDAYLKYDHCVEHELEHTDILGNENNDLTRS